jgi:hypothetical protein|nr:sulfite exporter TauE/SafE family protein [uncultured Acetatifactor sp.]
MDTTILLPAVTTAATVGLGCGTCCSPIISTFLSTYVVSHSNGVKKGVLSFVSFFAGKLISVTFLCMVAAALSKQFISSEGYIGEFNLRLAAQFTMSGIGAVLAVRWLLELKRGKHTCKGCHDCGKLDGKAGVLPMLCAGLTYGFTPCAPLLLMIGYSFTLPVPLAGATGVAFSLASMASPVLLLTVITGALSKKMRQEIPGCIKWFRLGSYLLLIVMPFVITI